MNYTCMNKTKPTRSRSGAFSLMELLLVITVIGILAGFTLAVMPGIKRQQNLKVARGEMEVLQLALDNYKAKYGTYPPANANSSMLNQLYYELSGTTFNNNTFTTLDGVSQIPAANVNTAYGVGGFVNCTKGAGEDAIVARNFLPNLKQRQFNTYVTNNGVRTTILITSVGGPDDKYQPLNASDLNPFRYAYPGTNNPNSYDLWVQLVMGGKTNLICNWSRQVIINSPLP
jgi:prepilin-type N-terminal cleavage/methylation domain-containing protein